MAWPGASQVANDADERGRILSSAEALQLLMGTSEAACCLGRIRAARTITDAKTIYEELVVTSKRVAIESGLAQLAHSKPSVEPDWECPVCLDGATEEIIGVCRSDGVAIHCFHKECIQGWLLRRNHCPCCQRAPLIELLSSISELDGCNAPEQILNLGQLSPTDQQTN
jgi:hypothetical protein